MSVAINRTPLPRLDPDLVSRWAAISTTIVADLFAGRGLADPAVHALQPLGNGRRLVGRAIVAVCEPPDFGAVPASVDIAEGGDVVVIAAGGDAATAMIGDIVCGVARRKGVKGVVCDGAVRDRPVLAEWTDFSVFSRSTIARGPSSKARGTVNASATFAGVLVNPGDLVLGDDDGLMFISPEDAAAFIEEAERRTQAELDWMERLAAGETLCGVFGVKIDPPTR